MRLEGVLHQLSTISVLSKAVKALSKAVSSSNQMHLAEVHRLRRVLLVVFKLALHLNHRYQVGLPHPLREVLVVIRRIRGLQACDRECL